jgi:hypothetical protein
MRRRTQPPSDPVYWPAFVDVLTAVVVVMLLGIGGKISETVTLRGKVKELEKQVANLGRENSRLAALVPNTEGVSKIRGKTEQQFIDERIDKRLATVLAEGGGRIGNQRATAAKTGIVVPILENPAVGLPPDETALGRVDAILAEMFPQGRLAGAFSDQDLEPVSIIIQTYHAPSDVVAFSAYGPTIAAHVDGAASTAIPKPAVTAAYTVPRSAGRVSVSLRVQFRLRDAARFAALADRARGLEP